MTTAPPPITAQERDQRLAWWREARFGLFIHWGLYAVPAGEWQGRVLPGIGEWLQAQFRVPLAEYRQCAAQFNPVHWDADAIARLAVAAGMKYIVITAKHHEGFAMWDSQVSDYTIVKATPFGRDPLRELAAACARHRLRLGFYYSQDLDWEHPDGAGNTWDFAPAGKDFQRYLDAKVKPQLRELLTGYGPVALLWFDTPCTISREQALDLKRLVQSLQPDCLVSGRIGHGIGDYGNLGDNQIPRGRLTGDWEVPATLNDTWGYKRGDRQWKSTATLLDLLIDVASKGANYLLNIGPDAEGRVPAPSVARLHELGAWLARHGEAIYGTQASPFPDEFAWGRVTRRGERLYLIVTHHPGGPFRLHGLRTPVRAARLLTDDTPLAVTQEGERLALALPVALPAPPFVIELVLVASPEVVPEPLQQPDGTLHLPAHLAALHVSAASAARQRPVDGNQLFAAVQGEAANQTQGDHLHIGPGGLLEHWHSPADSLSWDMHCLAPGTFTVHLHSVAAKYRDWVGGHRVRLRVAGQELAGVLTPDEVIAQPRTQHFAERATRLGTLTLPAAGRYRLDLRADFINDADPAGLCLAGVRLAPAEGSAP